MSAIGVEQRLSKAAPRYRINFPVRAGLGARAKFLILRSNRRQSGASAHPHANQRAEDNRERNPKQVVLNWAPCKNRFSAGAAPAARRTWRDEIGPLAVRTEAVQWTCEHDWSGKHTTRKLRGRESRSPETGSRVVPEFAAGLKLAGNLILAANRVNSAACDRRTAHVPDRCGNVVHDIGALRRRLPPHSYPKRHPNLSRCRTPSRSERPRSAECPVGQYYSTLLIPPDRARRLRALPRSTGAPAIRQLETENRRTRSE